MISDILQSTAKTRAQVKNVKKYHIVYEQLANIAINNFEWLNLPDGMRSRYIERALYEKGAACFLANKKQDKTNPFEYLVLKAAAMGNHNVYYEPVDWQVIGYNYTEQLKDGLNCVFIRNDILCNPQIWIVSDYAENISDIQRTIDTQLFAHKMTFILSGDEKQLLTLKNIVNNKANNELAQYVKKGITTDTLEVFDVNSPFIIDKLFAYKKEMLNEFYTLYGYNNTAEEKAERLIVDEVNSNNEVIENAYLGAMLEMRKEACEKINKLFGLNIDVKLRRDRKKEEYENSMKPDEQEMNNERGEENGDLHDDTATDN